MGRKFGSRFCSRVCICFRRTLCCFRVGKNCKRKSVGLLINLMPRIKLGENVSVVILVSIRLMAGRA